jgi:hypothetical protein
MVASLLCGMLTHSSLTDAGMPAQYPSNIRALGDTNGNLYLGLFEMCFELVLLAAAPFIPGAIVILLKGLLGLLAFNLLVRCQACTHCKPKVSDSTKHPPTRHLKSKQPKHGQTHLWSIGSQSLAHPPFKAVMSLGTPNGDAIITIVLIIITRFQDRDYVCIATTL